MTAGGSILINILDIFVAEFFVRGESFLFSKFPSPLLVLPALTCGVAPADALDAEPLINDQPGPLVHSPLVDEGRAV